MLREFAAYSGARLVFQSSELPRGSYHDIMVPLSTSRQRDAAEICLREVKKYPPGFLGAMRLEAIGIFAACASKQGDGYRPYDEQLGGYRYYGIWNGENGIAGAYYSDQQLPLTFHHEIFHHVDGTRSGQTDASRYFNSDDRQFASAIAGERPYAAPNINSNDLAKLRRIREGYVLKKSVSDYSAKAAGEDQAETARHFMSTLADSLVQIVEQPELAGSQRILHCLSQYEAAVDRGPNVQWFVNVAIGRNTDVALAAKDVGEAPPDVARASAVGPAKPSAAEIITRLQQFAVPGQTGWDGVADREAEARQTLVAAANLPRAELSPQTSKKLVDVAAEVTHQLARYRLQAKSDDDHTYAIRGREDADGINWTLRNDVAALGDDARRLALVAQNARMEDQEALTKAQLKNLRLLARYYSFIDTNWEVTGGTQQVFEAARAAHVQSLPAAQKSLAATLERTELNELARRIPADGTPQLLDDFAAPKTLPWLGLRTRDNPYLKLVDAEIGDRDTRAAIRAVQPACVRFDRASGVCVSPDGTILTAAHVAEKLGSRLRVEFPDGRSYTAKCTAFSEYLDLAVMQISGASDLPYAPLAADPPEVGTWVCAIGQPGGHTPSGEATGYGPFHVSTGEIRGFKEDRTGYQMLGGTKHDAWTYWGHSGCPLFNSLGQIVAMHNSWDSTTAMRHAVTHEAIVKFLKKADVDFAMAK
jgi:S1-C subfamily serine protease